MPPGEKMLQPVSVGALWQLGGIGAFRSIGCQHPRRRRQGQAHIKRGIRLDAVTEVILQIIVNPKGGTYRPLPGSSRVPGQADARLKQLLRVVLKQAGWADPRICLEQPR